MATTITQARTRLNGVTPIDEGGYEQGVDEDIDEFFDKDSLKLQLELAVRMAEVARSVSEWHRGSKSVGGFPTHWLFLVFSVVISVSGSDRDCYLPVVTTLLCRESRESTRQSSCVIDLGYNQRLVVLTRSQRNQ